MTRNTKAIARRSFLLSHDGFGTASHATPQGCSRANAAGGTEMDFFLPSSITHKPEDKPRPFA